MHHRGGGIAIYNKEATSVYTWNLKQFTREMFFEPSVISFNVKHTERTPCGNVLFPALKSYSKHSYKITQTHKVTNQNFSNQQFWNCIVHRHPV